MSLISLPITKISSITFFSNGFSFSKSICVVLSSYSMYLLKSVMLTIALNIIPSLPSIILRSKHLSIKFSTFSRLPGTLTSIKT